MKIISLVREHQSVQDFRMSVRTRKGVVNNVTITASGDPLGCYGKLMRYLESTFPGEDLREVITPLRKILMPHGSRFRHSTFVHNGL